MEDFPKCLPILVPYANTVTKQKVFENGGALRCEVRQIVMELYGRGIYSSCRLVKSKPTESQPAGDVLIIVNTFFYRKVLLPFTQVAVALADPLNRGAECEENKESKAESGPFAGANL